MNFAPQAGDSQPLFHSGVLHIIDAEMGENRNIKDILLIKIVFLQRHVATIEKDITSFITEENQIKTTVNVTHPLNDVTQTILKYVLGRMGENKNSVHCW